MDTPLYNSEDRDQSFLDDVIALAIDVRERAEKIMDLSDEPDVLRVTRQIETKARTIQVKAVKYRPRLVELKQEYRQRKREAKL